MVRVKLVPNSLAWHLFGGKVALKNQGRQLTSVATGCREFHGACFGNVIVIHSNILSLKPECMLSDITQC